MCSILITDSYMYCHTTDGPPTIGPPGPSAAVIDGPPGPCTAATLGLGGTIYGTEHHHSWSPIATDGPPPPDHSFAWLSASVAKYI